MTGFDDFLRTLLFRTFCVGKVKFDFMEALLAVCITGVGFALRTAFPDSGMPDMRILMEEWYLAVCAGVLVKRMTGRVRRGLYALSLIHILLNVVSGFLGIYAPVNMIFFLGFCFSLLIIFSLTVALSRLSNSVRTLDQMVALNEKRLQDLEQELKKEKAKHEEETDHHRM